MNRQLYFPVRLSCAPSIAVLSWIALLLQGPTTWAQSGLSNRSGESVCVVSLSGDQRLDVLKVSGDGHLERHSTAEIDAKPAVSCFDLTGQHLYVATSEPNTISVFRAQVGQLRKLQTVTVPAKPSYLWVTPSGQHLLASYYSTGQVTVHRIVGEGRLSDAPTQTIYVDPRAHCVMSDPSGKFVFVPHTQASRISQFRFDERSGRLTENVPKTLQREIGVSPRHVWFHPDGQYAFGSNESGRSISLYAMDLAKGILEERQTIASMPADFKGKATTSRVQGHPSGKFVYIANRGHGSLAAFAFDQEPETLRLLQRVKTGPMMRGFGISPDGRFLVAAGLKTNRLQCFRVQDDGTLKLATSIESGNSPWWVSFSPTTRENPSDEAPEDELTIDRSMTLGQGTMAGEVTATSVLIQTRLTKGSRLDGDGDLPGASGLARFEWSTDGEFQTSQFTESVQAKAERDFIARSRLSDLQPGTRYYYRVIFGQAPSSHQETGLTCSFRTLPGDTDEAESRFIVGSCMNYVKFMHGRAGNAGGPITATDEDKRLGFPAFETMRGRKPDFFVGTGDIVYYDNPYRVARTVAELRACWHEQFRFPRMIEFFQHVPCYWSKDDHDFRYNDSDNSSDRLPSSKTGISMFREQLPIAVAGDVESPDYRTHRVTKHLQIWLTEGRDHRSDNKSPDGPEKSMWGVTQRQWLKRTLTESDARWKVIVSPTPIVGPDDGYKSDNHANLKGFRREADDFFAWINDQKIHKNVVLVCGDRHWQYHSIHPSGVNEFACGALNDENSRMGVAPGEEYSSDPKGLVKQPFTSPEPSGGFLEITAGMSLLVKHFSDDGKQLYEATLP